MVTNDRLLLADGSSRLLLADGSSELLLTTLDTPPAGGGGAVSTVFIEFGFGSTWQTEPDDIVWTDVTQWVLLAPRVKTRRGASSARGKVDVGTIDFVLLNIDRRFDPLHAAGPYFGDLVPGVPVRARVFPEGEVGAHIFRGTVPSWPQRYDVSNRVAFVPIGGFDGFDKLSRAKIPQAVYPLEVLADSPVAYWRLDETTGNVMVDSSGNGVHGIYDNATIGEDPLIEDGNGKSMLCEGQGDNRGQYKGADLPTAAPVSLEAWVKIDRDLTYWHSILIAQRDNAFGSGLWLQVAEESDGSPNGEAVVEFRGLGGFLKFRGITRIDDGEPHHVVFTMASTSGADMRLYVDGVRESTVLISGTSGGTWTGHHLWVLGNVAASSIFDFGLTGHIDEVAIYDSALSAARVLAHYEAGADALAGQTTDERIGYILDGLGWPAGLRDLEVGQSLLGSATFRAGDQALDYLRMVEATEDGKLYVTADGDIRFLDRYWRFLDPAATASQFSFTDDGTADQHYAEFQLDLDDELLVNTARVTRRDGAEQVASDATSISAYGEAEVQVSTLHGADNEALSLAEWIVATSKDPQPRCPNIRIPLTRYSAAAQQAILDLDIGHRVTVERTPQGVGSVIELDMVIDGIAHDLDTTTWWVTLFVSPTPDATFSPFRWDVSEWDGSDAWAH